MPEPLDQEAPDWSPLLAVVGREGVVGWMWMNRSSHAGIIVEHYKHRHTRNYLNLDHAGHAWTSRIVSHGCSPWCECPAGQGHVEDVFEHFTVPLGAAIAEALS